MNALADPPEMESFPETPSASSPHLSIATSTLSLHAAFSLKISTFHQPRGELTAQKSFSAAHEPQYLD
jgi:hypothetical protein